MKLCFLSKCRRNHLTISFKARAKETNPCLKSVQIGSFSGPNTGKYGPEKTSYLNTFHAVKSLHRNVLSILSFKTIYKP